MVRGISWVTSLREACSFSQVDNSVLPAVLKYPAYLLGWSRGPTRILGAKTFVCHLSRKEGRVHCVFYSLF